MKRSPIVKKDAIGHGRQIGYGDKIIHVLEEPADYPQNAFVGDFLTWRGSQNLYVKNKDGVWVKVDRRMSVYQDVMARLRGEGINPQAGDDS